MIPEKTLEIIREEAKNQAFIIEIIPSNWGQPKQEVRHRDSNMEESFIAGAKRGYELAMGDRWIDAKDRTPDLIEGKDYSENVLVWCDGCLGVMAYTWINGFGEPENAGYVWANCNSDINGDAEFDDNYYPTHWQPLPSLPKPKP